MATRATIPPEADAETGFGIHVVYWEGCVSRKAKTRGMDGKAARKMLVIRYSPTVGKQNGSPLGKSKGQYATCL